MHHGQALAGSLCGQSHADVAFTAVPMNFRPPENAALGALLLNGHLPPKEASPSLRPLTPSPLPSWHPWPASCGEGGSRRGWR